MNLQEVCEPLFLYLCHLNRAGRSGAQLEITTVRDEIAGRFTEMQTRAAQDSQCLRQFEKMEIPLKFFVDSMIAESKLNFAAEWNRNRLAYEWKELAGDEKFFDLLDETLEETGEAATERLIIFYTCLGLGFCGFYAGKVDYIKKKMRSIASRIRKHVKLDSEARTCPEAYENVDTRNLIQPPGQKLIGIAIAFVGLLIVLFVTNAILFRQASNDLFKSLTTIIRHDPAAAAPAAPAADRPYGDRP